MRWVRTEKMLFTFLPSDASTAPVTTSTSACFPPTYVEPSAFLWKTPFSTTYTAVELTPSPQNWSPTWWDATLMLSIFSDVIYATPTETKTLPRQRPRLTKSRLRLESRPRPPKSVRLIGQSTGSYCWHECYNEEWMKRKDREAQALFFHTVYIFN